MFGTPCCLYLLLFVFPPFFFLVEVSPPMAGRVLEEKVVSALSVAFPGMEEEEPPSDGMAEETGQPMHCVQAIQDPEAS